MISFHKLLRISPEFDVSPTAHDSLVVYFQNGCSKQLYQACSYLLLSWRCRAPSPVAFFEELWTTGLQRREPTADFTFLVCRERSCSRWFLVLCQGYEWRGNRTLLCTSPVFICLHRCMSSASALMCEILMHLFTVRMLERLLKWTWVGFVLQNRFYIFFLSFFWPFYLFILLLKCN